MLWAVVGTAALLAGLALSVFSAMVSFAAGRRDDPFVTRAARRGFYAAAAMVILASGCLLAGLLGHDFRLAYVTAHTDRALATPLIAAAFYSGQEGSLLYWTLVLTVLGSASVAAAGGAGVRLRAYATGVLAAIATFLLVVMVFAASPFDLLTLTPRDGLGLNPVLRDGGMLIHPPFLLAGFSAFSIPFSFALAALLAGRQDAAWIAQTRRVGLLAWALQGTGLLLGMWWAYHVLGWGGYWGWDPVENVALLPWLAATAYIHSAQAQERSGQLRAWTLALVLLAFVLAVLGTFIARSGVLVSVHTFAVSAVGPWFFAFLAVAVGVSGALLAARWDRLRSERPLESPVSREGAFLLQNLLLVGLIAAVLWGTLLPLLSGLVGPQRVVGAAYYERVAGPLLAGLVALLAVGPLIPWRGSGSAWRRSLAWPAAASAVALAGLLLAGVRQPAALVVMALLAGAAGTALREYALAVRLGRRLAGPGPRAALRLAARNRRRYAAHLAHFGLVVAAAGIAGSHFWQSDRTVTLSPGQTVQVAGYRLEYVGGQESTDGDHTELVARLSLGGETLEPSRLSYPGLGGQSLSRVAIRSTPLQDLYVVLNGRDESGAASIRILVNPLVPWIWAGGALLILGVLIGHLPVRPRPASSAAPAPAPVAAR
jgi:cytochrome c-type biogenesis protein CcmF